MHLPDKLPQQNRISFVFLFLAAIGIFHYFFGALFPTFYRTQPSMVVGLDVELCTHLHTAIQPPSNFTKGNRKKTRAEPNGQMVKKRNNSDCVINEIICSECDAISHSIGRLDTDYFE